MALEVAKIPPHSAIGQQGPAGDGGYGDGDVAEFEAIERQELLNEAYDSGYSVGFDAGVRTEAARSPQKSAEIVYAEGYTTGQRAEQGHVRACLEELSRRTAQNVVIPGLFSETTLQWSEPPRWSEPNTFAPSSGPSKSQLSGADTWPVHPDPAMHLQRDAIISGEVNSAHQPPLTPTQPINLAPAAPEATLQMRHEARPRKQGEWRHQLTTCVFCGREVSANSLMRHKKRRHPVELAAAGVEVQRYPCWFPGCGMLQDNFVPNQLTTHLQRKHNCTPPGDPNAFTENLKYLGRMPKKIIISMISEAAQQINAVKERIKSLEAQLRLQNPEYVSRHGLPTLNHLLETRTEVLASVLVDRSLPPLIVQELRQLTRARGMRSQIRHDEGTWWEVADDLEAALNPSGTLAQAVAALPPPDPGPTVPMAPGLLTEGPNMKDPSWKPRYALPWQLSWAKATDGNEEPDGVIVPPEIHIPKTNFEIVIPYMSRPAAMGYDEVEDEEEEGYQRLMAEIEQRVVDNDDVSHDESEKTDRFEEDDAHLALDHSTQASSQRPLKRFGPTALISKHNKRQKLAQSSLSKGDSLE
ncbi:hypothetical protein SLS53_000749 [Cytospora paraplurivora]|uniref:Uncharacterized protein n=1 Tax=Cytospora paraplurivora TaxID=2898453 RepID=A0AAN9UKG8_9PEZI